jgi:hypothetical protein
MRNAVGIGGSQKLCVYNASCPDSGIDEVERKGEAEKENPAGAGLLQTEYRYP